MGVSWVAYCDAIISSPEQNLLTVGSVNKIMSFISSGKSLFHVPRYHCYDFKTITNSLRIKCAHTISYITIMKIEKRSDKFL